MDFTMKVKRLLSASVLLLASALPLALIAAAPTTAYASGTQIQAAISLNCNNPSFCGSDGLGGFWGSAQFNSDGTASAQLIGCSHLQGGGPAAGAQHLASTVADLNGQPGWFVGSNGDIWVTNSTDTFTGRNGGPPVTAFDPFPPYPSDTGIPAAPGHYNTTELLGFTPPPWVSFQIQVTQLPG
jgi:hypothetical protein